MMSEKILTKDGIVEFNNDGYVSLMNGVAGAQGAAGMSSPTARRMMARISAGMIPHNSLMLDAQSGIAHRIVAEPVAAAMLAGYSIVTDDHADAEKIQQFFDDWQVWKKVGNACCARRAAGYSIVVLGDSFIRHHPGYRAEPSAEWHSDYNSPLFGLPVGWIVQLKAPMGGTAYIPQEDSILLGDAEADTLYQMPGNYFGVSVLARVYAALERLGLSHELVISILSMSIQDIYKRIDLNEDLDTPKGEQKVARRLGGIAATRMLNDMIAVDNEEEITRLQSTMTGLDKLIDIAIRVISAESGFPVSVLANTSAGISNNDDSGDEVWQRIVESESSGFIVPTLQKIALHYLGIRAKFVPNKSQGDIRRDAEADKLRAETAKLYYDMRAVTSEEAREQAGKDAAVPLLSDKMPTDADSKSGDVDDEKE